MAVREGETRPPTPTLAIRTQPNPKHHVRVPDCFIIREVAPVVFVVSLLNRVR